MVCMAICKLWKLVVYRAPNSVFFQISIHVTYAFQLFGHEYSFVIIRGEKVE